MECENVVVIHRELSNKGRHTGQKPPVTNGEIWIIRTRLRVASNVCGLAPPSRNRAILRGCRSMMSVAKALWRLEPQSCSGRTSGGCDSRSWPRPAGASKRGSKREDHRRRIFCSQVGCICHSLCRAAMCAAGTPLDRIDWSRRHSIGYTHA